MSINKKIDDRQIIRLSTVSSYLRGFVASGLPYSHTGWLGAAMVLVALAGCGGSPTPPPVTLTIGAAGGTVTGPSGAKVVIPAGALSKDTPIGIAQSGAGAPALPGGTSSLGQTFAFTPHGTSFAVPVTLTVPFDLSKLPAGTTPVLYKTNAAQSGWDVVAGATVNGNLMTGQVTGFSHAQVVIPPLVRNDPERFWTFIKFDGNGPVEPFIDGGPQKGGVVSQRHEFGPLDPVFELDGGDSRGVSVGEVFSSASGETYWAATEENGLATLGQGQSFIKRAPDATLQVVLTAATLQAVDANHAALPSECPRLKEGMSEGEINAVCHPIYAHVQFSTSAYLGPFMTTNNVFFRVNGLAKLGGFEGHWSFDATDSGDALQPLWTKGNFAVGGDGLDGGAPRITLNRPLVLNVDLSSVPVCPPQQSAESCKDKAFTLHSTVLAFAINGRGRESGVAAFVRDPQKTGGSSLKMTGLEATNNPAPPPTGVQAPLACASPNPAAGTLQFSAAAYTALEGPAGGGQSILVTRTKGSQGAVSVTFSASDGTAVAGVNYTAPPVTVRFGDGDTAPRLVALTVLSNTLAEPDKTVNLRLADPGGCATLGAPASAVLTLLDDDQPPPPPPPSGLDASFGNAGKANAERFGGDRSAMALQPDGKIVMVGGTFTDFILARFNPDGSLDSGFGSGGKVTTDMVQGVQEEALGVAVQPDGKIVVVGYAGVHTVPPAPSQPANFALARYNPDGTLDTSFGVGGKVTSGVVGQAFAALIQPDGRIVVAGDFIVPKPLGSNFSDFALARYNPDGTLDTGFGNGGLLTTDIGDGANHAGNVVLQPNGAIVVSGKPIGSSAGFDHTDLVRYNANGGLDSSFGSGGKLALSGKTVGEGLVLQSDGKLVLAGSVAVGSATEFALMRLNPDGSPDSTFGNAGTVSTAITAGQRDAALAVALQSDGKIVAAGQTKNINTDFALARYNTNGTLDTGFGNGGKLTVDFFGFTDLAESVALQPDGKIVLGGLAEHNFDGYGLARLNP